MGLEAAINFFVPLVLLIFAIFVKSDLLDTQISDESGFPPGDVLLRNGDSESATNCCSDGVNFPGSSLVLVSTLDGYITALNAKNNGDIVWSIKTDSLPLFGSTIGNLQFSNGDANYRLIPSLDGNFYMYDDAVAQGIPVSAESLLSSSMKFGSDVISGGKEVRTFGLKSDSGEVVYSYTLNEQKPDSKASTSSGEGLRSNLVIKRTTRTIRAVEATTGIQRWNVTVGEHEIFTPDPAFTDLSNENSANVVEFRLSPADGIIAAFKRHQPYKPIWSKKLDSPIAQLWSLDKGFVKELSLFDPKVVPYLPTKIVTENRDKSTGAEMVLYLGTYDNEKYIIPSPEERQKLRFLIAQQNYLPADSGRLYLAANSFDLNLMQSSIVSDYDEHSTTENNKCLNNCPTCSSDSVRSFMLKDQYSKDMGSYLFMHHKNTKRLTYVKADAGKSTIGAYSKREKFKYVMWTWWNIFLFVGAPTSLVSLVIWYLLKRMCAYDISMSNDCNHSATVSMVHALSQVSEADLGLVEQSASSVDVPYESWYLNHFEPIRCLGKGGFGIVIESLNKLDQQIYAVKRIRVSNKPDGKERVQREVTTLAKLDHPGIVRYYNSWLEVPPLNWVENWDREFLMKCSIMPSSSIDTTTASTRAGNFRLKKTKDGDDSLLKIIDAKVYPNGFRNVDLTGASAILKSAEGLKISNGKYGPRNASESSLEIVFERSDGSRVVRSGSFSTRRSALRVDKELQTSDGGGKRCGDVMFIQMQLCHDQTLSDWLRSNSKSHQRPRHLLLDWFDQLVCAVQCVHENGLIHRDLKPSNIFFGKNNSQLRIGDFGLAKCVTDDDLTDESASMDNCDARDNVTVIKSTPRSDSHTDNVGTWLYMSPEQEKGGSYTLKVDIYALGLIFFEMLTPFSTEMERRLVLNDLKLKELKFPAGFEQNFPNEFSLIKNLITHDPGQRLTCMQIRSLDLFAPFWPQRPVAVVKRQRNSSSIHILNGVTL